MVEVFINTGCYFFFPFCCFIHKSHSSLCGGELGDGLGALGHGVLGELTGERQAHGGLDLAGGEGGLLVVAAELGGLTHNLVKDVIDEGVHDHHALLGDASLGVHLLQDLVDVGVEGLGALALLGLLGASGGGLCCLCGLLGGSCLGHLRGEFVGRERERRLRSKKYRREVGLGT